MDYTRPEACNYCRSRRAMQPAARCSSAAVPVHIIDCQMIAYLTKNSRCRSVSNRTDSQLNASLLGAWSAI
jgi:hypothetical protein